MSRVAIGEDMSGGGGAWHKEQSAAGFDVHGE